MKGKLFCPECSKELANVNVLWDRKNQRKWTIFWALVYLTIMIVIFYGQVFWREVDPEFDENTKLVILNHSEKQDEDCSVITGRIKNDESNAWTMVTLEAEFFDKDKRFVDECVRAFRWTISPGGEENFKMDCGCRMGENIPDGASYDLRIIAAF